MAIVDQDSELEPAHNFKYINMDRMVINQHPRKLVSDPAVFDLSINWRRTCEDDDSNEIHRKPTGQETKIHDYLAEAATLMAAGDSSLIIAFQQIQDGVATIIKYKEGINTKVV